ncbi:hypothetical protein Mapa_000268 [Marchantia paleacea]|nr:hypothetical protein Mapa_000268 [Marchantia paleacea]
MSSNLVETVEERCKALLNASFCFFLLKNWLWSFPLPSCVSGSTISTAHHKLYSHC